MRRPTRNERILLAIFFVALLIWIAFHYRTRVETWWWHHEHGETLAVDEYRVPAPRNWRVIEQGLGRLLVREDTDDRTALPPSGTRLKFPATVSVWNRYISWDSEKLKRWTRLEAAILKKKGADPISRDFDVGGETLACVGGQKFTQAVDRAQFYVNDPVIWSCASSGRLEVRIVATDADMPQAWEIISGIRKLP